MYLTLKEVRRARRLQRRLKLMRLWFRIGKFLYKPWSCLQPTWDRWYLELKILRDKMILNTPSSARIRPDCKYTREELKRAAEEVSSEFTQIMNLLNGANRTQ